MRGGWIQTRWRIVALGAALALATTPSAASPGDGRARLDDLPLKDLLRMFPEGRYRLVGETTDGSEMIGLARLTHDIPAGPTVVTPEEGAVTPVDDTLIDWEPVVKPVG